MTRGSPVRVLHVLPCDELAGTELMVASLILHADPALVSHELATLQPPGPIAARVGAGTRRVASLGGRGGLLAATARLGRLLRARDYDVVSAYGLKASLVARILVRLLRRRAVFICGVRALHVTEVERMDSLKARIASLVERLLSPLVDVYDANSRAALAMLGRSGVRGARLVYIPNGLDLSQWMPRRPDQEDGETPLVLCAARFVARKRHEDLLQALALLAGRGHRFRAVLAGDGPRLDAMRRLASSLHLDAAVELPGPLGPGELRGLLERAAVACLPSTFEGMPGALMEAMARAVAVVATDVDGTNELVVDGESGLLVPVYDPPALAAALASVLEDRELRDRLASGGRSRMEECFSLEVMLRQKERLFREVAASMTGPRSQS